MNLNFKEYTSEALLQILKLCDAHPKYEGHEKAIEQELRERLQCYDHNVATFSPYCTIINLTKTKEDFFKSHSP